MHHGVRITDSALVVAATLSNRYITDRFLPDKAIDLIDEAASRLRMEVDSKARGTGQRTSIAEIIQLKIEREALRKESADAASRDRLERLEKELAELEEEPNCTDHCSAVGKGAGAGDPEAEGATRPGAQRSGDSPAPR